VLIQIVGPGERRRCLRSIRAAAGCSPELAARRAGLVALGRGEEDPAAALEAARAERQVALERAEMARRRLAEAILDVEDAREVHTAGEAPSEQRTGGAVEGRHQAQPGSGAGGHRYRRRHSDQRRGQSGDRPTAD